MSKAQATDVKKFLKPFSTERKKIVLKLREFIWDLYPEANELIYDNYNALAIGWSLTDRAGSTFCTLALFRTNENIHFGFYRGSEINDPDKILIGNGKQYRYILVSSLEQFPKVYIKRLLAEAYVNALTRLKDQKIAAQSLTIVKATSEVKRVSKMTKRIKKVVKRKR